MSHAGFPTLSACVTTERRAGLLRWEGGERGGGVVRFRSRFARTNSRALIYQIPYPTFGRRSGGRGSGDATSCGRWRGATIAERRVASDRSGKRGVPRSSPTHGRPSAPLRARDIFLRSTHLTTALLVAGLDLTPPLLLAAAPRRDPAAATGLALTAARVITSCDIADDIVHLARSDLIRAPRIAWLVDSGLGRPGWMRWRKLGARVFGRRSTLWALGPLGERGRRRWGRLRSKVNQRRRLEHLSPIGRRSCERPIDDPRRAGFFSLLALKNQTAVDKNIDRVTPVFRSRKFGPHRPQMRSDKPSSVSHRPGFGRAGTQLANRESRKAEFCREAQSENGWRSVCAFIQEMAFWLLFAIFAGSCTRNWFARDRQKATKIFSSCLLVKSLCLLPRRGSVNPTRRRGSARAWPVEPWGLGGDGHSQPTSRRRLHRIHPVSGSPDRDSAPSC